MSLRITRRFKPSARHLPPAKTKPARTPSPFVAELKSTGDHADALRLLLAAPPHLQDYASCASLLHRLARARLFPLLDSLLLFARSRRIPLKEPVFNSLIRHFGRAGLPDRAFELFRSVPSFNCPGSVPSTQTLNFLLDALVANGALSDAEVLLSNCSKDWNLRPNVVSYNIILKGRCSAGGIESARKLFDEMLKRRARPSVVSYNILIGCMSRNGDLDGSMRLKDAMVRKGTRPNAVTFALLMEGLCLVGRHEAARKMMFDMQYHGCRTGVVNYGVLMSDCARRGDFDGMKELHSEMKKRRLKPDVVTYNIFIGYLCGEGRVDEAYKILVEMQIKGCEPGAATYRMMVDGFCTAREFEKGLRILNTMLASKHCPRAESFESLVVGLCEVEKLDDACFVLEEMEKRKIGLGSDGWAALVKAICGECCREINLHLIANFQHSKSQVSEATDKVQ